MEPDQKQKIYKDLEDQFVKYADLVGVAVTECNALMVPITDLAVNSIDPGMAQYTGNDIYVRQPLIPLLKKAELFLQETHPDFRLQIVYGYRHISIQSAKYQDIKSRIYQETGDHAFMPGSIEPASAKERIHRYIAVPEVSGHPTGGAVDLQIIDEKDHPLPMGTDIHSFEEDSYVFSPFISDEAKHNRNLLRDAMLKAGFAPFDGEWWHFSYGDREWAFYYDHAEALFSQIEFQAL